MFLTAYIKHVLENVKLFMLRIVYLSSNPCHACFALRHDLRITEHNKPYLQLSLKSGLVKKD